MCVLQNFCISNSLHLENILLWRFYFDAYLQNSMDLSVPGSQVPRRVTTVKTWMLRTIVLSEERIGTKVLSEVGYSNLGLAFRKAQSCS